MNRFETAFAKPAFIAYLTAGNPSLDKSFDYAMALIDSGVSILEIGVPFSDPVADGPVIQHAMQQAINNGTTLDDTLNLIKRLREKSDIAIVLFSYFNPILCAGDDVYQKAKEAGVDGILIVDLPLEEQEKHLAQCQEHDIAPIQVISTVSDEARIENICQHAKGFIYYACRKGTTGAKANLPDNYSSQISMIKQHTSLPVATGFGIASHAIAKAVLEHSDGFVVGSYLVDKMNQDITTETLKKLSQDLIPS